MDEVTLLIQRLAIYETLKVLLKTESNQSAENLVTNICNNQPLVEEIAMKIYMEGK